MLRVFILLSVITNLQSQVLWNVSETHFTKWILQSSNEFDKFTDDTTIQIDTNASKNIKDYFFEIRFKNDWKNQIAGHISLQTNTSNEIINLINCKNSKLNEFSTDIWKEKIISKKVKFKNKFGANYNIVSAKIENNILSYYFNGILLYEYKVGFKNSPHIIYGFNTIGCRNIDSIKEPFIFDYIRTWVKADSIEYYNDSYEKYKQSSQNIIDGKLTSIDPIKKKSFFRKTKLNEKQSNITLLPILYNKYSLSLLGKKLGEVRVEVFDRFEKKVAGYTLNNIEYYVMDLSALPTGSYKIKIQVNNQLLTHELSIINPAKVGEQ